MKTKVQIKTLDGSVLFEYESNNNTKKRTLEKAVDEGADLRSADLRSAYLRSAYLTGADLTGADLRSADLRGAYLTGADLKKIQSYFQVIPEEGSFIGWKKANGCLIKLEIPAKAKRHNSLGGRKCRASYVKALQIWDSDGNEINECCGSHDKKTIYKIGRLTKPDKYDPSPLKECSNGIHFFITKQEALDW